MKPAMMRRFLFLHLATAAGLVFLIVALNLLMDPTGLRQLTLGTSPGICASGLNMSGRLVKAIGLMIAEPDVLIAGTSKARAGIPAGNAWLRERYGEAYNLGFSGALIEELVRYIHFSLSYKQPDTLFISVEPGMFFHIPVRQRNYIDLATSPSEMNLLAQKVKLYRLAILSQSALIESLSSLFVSENCLNPRHSLNGDQKPHDLNASEQRNISLYSEDWLLRLFASDNALQKIGRRYERSLNLFEHLISRSCRLGVNVHLFVPPVHVRMAEIFHRNGTWPFMETMMRDLVKLRRKLASTGCAITFTNFMAYNEITTEPLPSSELDPAMRFYFESSHFRPDVGAMILRYIAKDSDDEERFPNNFGVDLHEDNIEQHLVDLEEQRKNYIEHHPTAFDDLGGPAFVPN